MTGSPFPERPRRTLSARGIRYELGRRTQVMAILNLTPDSFSDGGRHAGVDAALRRLEEIWREGADWVDLGGESTRPGAAPVSGEEEWSRVGPVLAAARRRAFPLPISIDTTKSFVAARALEAGASMINDVSALRFDPGLADLAATSGAALVLMHMRGEPRTMQDDTRYGDLEGEIRAHLGAAARLAEERGVHREQVVVDPGIGFGKDLEQNLRLIAAAEALGPLGFPVLVGASRKSFLGRLLGLPVEQRGPASAAAHVAAVLAGAHFVRVHEVRETVHAVRTADAILAARRLVPYDRGEPVPAHGDPAVGDPGASGRSG